MLGDGCFLLYFVLLLIGEICTSAEEEEVGVTVVSIAKNGGVVHENDTIMITCCAYNGLADGFEWARLDGPEIPSKAVGVNSSTLLIPNASLDDLGLYACSSLQTNQSNPVQIVFTGGLYDPPHIVSYLANPVVEEGSNLTISCTATGYPPPEYHWERQRQAMPSKALGVESRILTIPDITMEDGGSYTCTVTNPAGVDESKPIFPILISTNASLYDLPVVVSVPDDPLFEEGSTLILECCAEGDPLPVYAWTRLDEEMPSKAVGVTSHSLLISNTTISDIGVYACMAFNEGGVLQSSSIQTFFRPYGPPVIASISNSMTVDDGTDVRLNCSATGFPSPSYQWLKVNGEIPSTAVGVNSSTLLIPTICEDGEGIYICRATNMIGTAESSPIQITVIPPYYVPPSINSTTTTPTVEEGSDLALTCYATGTPSPTYTWIRLDKSMPSKAQGVDSSTLIIPQIDWSDIGVYACLAINELGRTQSRPIYVIMQAQAGTSISSSIIARRKRDETTQQTMMIGGVVGSILLVIVTLGAFMSVVCFKRGLFGVSTSYSVPNVSVWDVMVGKNKGQNLFDFIIRVKSLDLQNVMPSESSDSVLRDPRVTRNIQRPYEVHNAMATESSDSVLRDPRVTRNIQRPYELHNVMVTESSDSVLRDPRVTRNIQRPYELHNAMATESRDSVLRDPRSIQQIYES